ncbi:MAG: MBL fold metallo-hydrolase, partial [Bacteriovoracaceae bacterium]|nr:MBL fold metallo-hydrolase [Bacteriovoracaceae bacterium]
MQIHQIYTHSALRNFTYLLESSKKGLICIDPFDAPQVISFAKDLGKQVSIVINTHEHWDHTQGNQELVDAFSCEVLAHENGKGKIPCVTRFLSKGDVVEIDEENQLEVLDTPGHTFAHLCFLLKNNNKASAVFTGDTLFNAGVGNCHNGGDPEVLYETICQQFHTMDGEVKVYPGHEYLGNNLKFTLDREPGNLEAKKMLDDYKTQGTDD